MLIYFRAIWNILQIFGIFMTIWYVFPVLVYCIRKNLATLLQIRFVCDLNRTNDTH
jgi:hypothetical protein